jgi:alpha-tubulin suppressor-like RCC1 family protein
MVEAAEKTIVPEQPKGDCKIAICDGRGGVTALSDDKDWPGDDDNPCTDEVCEEGAAEHPPLVVGTPCEVGDVKDGVCNGAGKCGVCLPGAKQCSGNETQACNDDGQWTEPDACPEASPVCVRASCVGLRGVAAGGRHTCASFNDGSARCWGDRSSGRLGGGGGFVTGVQGAVEITAGADHTCARLSDGSALCWGSNGDGELGDGTTDARGSPAPVKGAAGIAQIAAGGGFTCARLADGQVKCWGRNDLGQLGTGAISKRQATAAQGGAAPDPAPIRSGVVLVPSVAGAQALSLGRAHSCALIQGGRVTCWGDNSVSQHGRGGGGEPAPGKVRPAPPKPLASVRGLKDAAEIALGEAHACARLTSGGVRCWGDNTQGQLGDGTTKSKPAPAEIKDLTGAAALALGTAHACALLQDGTVRCWGSNAHGQLGDGTTTSRPTPAPVSGLEGAKAISARGDHTCAHLQSGGVRCWGSNAAGQIDQGQEGARTSPSRPTW